MANPPKGILPTQVERLRALLIEADIYWAPVRDHPRATYLPDTGYTIWWQGPAMQSFLWGHDFEFHDATAEEVLTRLKGLS